MSSNDLVVGVDGSAGAQRALRWAVEEARLRDALLLVVYVWQPPELHDAGADRVDPDVYGKYEAELQPRAQQVLDEALAGVRDVKVEPVLVRSHQVAAELVERSRKTALLVVGSRGRGGFSGLFLGSVSQQCVLHADCPVVVVPPARELTQD